MPAPAFLGPLALIFLAALGAAYLLHRLRQPPLIGYLAAGAFLGPYGLGLVHDVSVVESLAELGVVLLLFTIGLELSLRNLRRLGPIVSIAAPVQIVATIALVFLVARSRGIPPAASLFAGYLVALSSTAIVLKLLSERREVDAPHGKFLIGILIVQDLAVVPMLLSLELVSDSSGRGAGAALLALVKTAAATGALVVVARVLVPRFIGALAGTRQKEIFVVAVLFLAAAIVTMIATPLLSEVSHGIAERAVLPPRARPREASSPAASENHVLVFGYGHMGVTVARLLRQTRTPFRVLDLDPDRVRRGRKQGVPIEYGDSTNDHVLRRAGIEKARAAIVLLPDARTARQTLKHCRRLAPKLILVARTRYGADIPALVGDGADEVVAEEIQSSLEIANRTMERLGLRTPWLEAETEELRRARLESFRRFRQPGADS